MVGVGHALLVAPHYHVGSFDDDAASLVMAKGIVGGTGLSGYLPTNIALVNAYPPGFAYLISPLVALFGTSTFAPERLLALVTFAAIFPLTWTLLRRRGFSPPFCLVVLALLALDPVLATYATMVMAETTFVVVFLCLLLVGERWLAGRRAVTWSGAGTVLLLAATVWLKEAAVVMILAAVVLLLWRRQLAKTVFLLVATLALVSPIAIARWMTSTPLAGARYSSEISGYYQGGLLHRLLVVVPKGVGSLLFDAFPSAILPTDSPLSDHLAVFVVFRGLACALVAVFVTVGAVTWARRYGADLALFLVAGYVIEVVFYNFVIERRIVLVLPVAAAWTVLGGAVSVRWLLDRTRRRQPASLPRLRQGLVVAGVVVVALPLLIQFRTDYLFRSSQQSSRPDGSPYMKFLARLGTPASHIETDYMWTTMLFTGHTTGLAAFPATKRQCTNQVATSELASDDASFLLVAAIDDVDVLDSPCLLHLASTEPWAVRLEHTPHDSATVFELIGPGTGHPDLENLLTAGAGRRGPAAAGGPGPGGGRAPSAPAAVGLAAGSSDGSGTVTPVDGTATVEWPLPTSASVTQVSLGTAYASAGPTGAVTVQLRETDGRWHTIASAPGAVGGEGTPLLATPPGPTHASAVRVTVATSSTGRGAGLRPGRAGQAMSTRRSAACAGPARRRRGPRAAGPGAPIVCFPAALTGRM